MKPISAIIQNYQARLTSLGFGKAAFVDNFGVYICLGQHSIVFFIDRDILLT
jgi:hypothetical protein